MGKWILGVLAALYVAGFAVLLVSPANLFAQSEIGWLKPKLEEAIAHGYVEDVRQDKIAAVEAVTDPQYVTQATPELLGKIASIFPAGPPVSVKLVGSNVLYFSSINSSSTTRYDLIYEYEFPDKWVFAEIIMQRTGGKLQIESIHVEPMSMSLERLNAFSFTSKSSAQILFLVLMLLDAAFITVTGFICLATPIPRLKWLWIIFVVFGLVTITLNWTTGAWNVQLLSLALFGVAASKAPYAPVMLQISLPIGAVIFWMRRGQWLRQAQQGLQVAAPP